MQYYIPEGWNPHLYLCEKLQKLQNNTQMEHIFALFQVFTVHYYSQSLLLID